MTPWQLRQAARIVHQGGIIAYPTEAVFGLGCDPLNGAAVMRLLRIKQRDPAKGLILIAADFAQLQPYLAEVTAAVLAKVRKSWPGPYTWLLPVAAHVPTWLTGAHDKLAVRVTAHPIAAALCRACGGPLVSTSANLAGQAPARNSLAVQQRLGNEVDMIIHGATGGLRQPTAITDALTDAVVRAN